MNLSEYTPKMVYLEDSKGGILKRTPPVTSVLKKVFESFDDSQKGFVSGDDLGRVLKKLTGEDLSENEKQEMIAETSDESSSMGLSLSNFSRLFAGLKHKHYPRGHVIFNAGDEGDAMYFINRCVCAVCCVAGVCVCSIYHNKMPEFTPIQWQGRNSNKEGTARSHSSAWRFFRGREFAGR